MKSNWVMPRWMRIGWMVWAGVMGAFLIGGILVQLFVPKTPQELRNEAFWDRMYKDEIRAHLR